MPLFKFEDVEINYVKRGRGEPLVLIQGLGQKISSWILQMPYFRRKMMIIALDNRGVGDSSRPNYPYTMDMFVDEIKGLLDFLNIHDKIHLMGISMGGMIAQNFVLKYPEMVKTLILLATSAYLDPNPYLEQAKFIIENLDLEKGFQKKLDSMFSKSFIKQLKEDKILYDALKNKMMLENPTRLQDYINRAAAISGHDTRNSLHNIKQPTLIMVGIEDQIIPFEHSKFLHEKIPNSILQEFPGFGHGSLLVEDAEKINDLIWNFIKEHIE